MRLPSTVQRSGNNSCNGLFKKRAIAFSPAKLGLRNANLTVDESIFASHATSSNVYPAMRSRALINSGCIKILSANSFR
nr:MAG TPA: hypothetical protein [Caudoviricetes sp.]